MTHDQAISIAKTVAWEEAKGKLRLVAALEGQHTSERSSDVMPFHEISATVETFIQDFEAEGFHE